MKQLCTYTNNRHVFVIHVRDENSCTLSISGIVTHVLDDINGTILHGVIHPDDTSISIVTKDGAGIHYLLQYRTDLTKENATEIKVTQLETQVLELKTGLMDARSVDGIVGGADICYLNVTVGTQILGKVLDKHKCVYTVELSSGPGHSVSVQKMTPWVSEIYAAAGKYAIGRGGNDVVMAIVGKNNVIVNTITSYTGDLDNFDITSVSMFGKDLVTIMLGGVVRCTNTLSCIVADMRDSGRAHTLMCGNVLDTGYRADGEFMVTHVGGYVMAVVFKANPLSYVRLDTYVNNETWMYTSPRLTSIGGVSSLLAIPNTELTRV